MSFAAVSVKSYNRESISYQLGTSITHSQSQIDFSALSSLFLALSACRLPSCALSCNISQLGGGQNETVMKMPIVLVGDRHSSFRNRIFDYSRKKILFAIEFNTNQKSWI